jgi:hypothetical protein
MLRKAVLSIAVALFSLSLFVIGVLAQTGGTTTGQEAETPITLPISVQPNVAAANVVQTVPVTLTLSIPGPTGPVTIEVPIFLSLDIRIGISPQLTTTLSVTPSVVSEVDAGVEAETDATPTVIATPTEEVTVVETEVPATPVALAPTATAPPADVEPTAVALPTPTPTVALEAVAVAPTCQDPRAAITSPGVNQVLSGTVNIIGTASHENFQYYKVEYAEGVDVDPNNSFAYLADARVQVVGALLAAFDSTSFINGAYTIKLTVVDNSGNFPPPCTVSVVIAN